MRPSRAALASAALACGTPATVETPTPPPSVVSADPACEAPPADALASLPSSTCPWLLVPDQGGLALRPPSGPTLRVEPPQACRPCRFSGAVTDVGPLVLATRPAPTSELADAAWLGASDGSALLFAPLWLDRPALGDSTLLGPPYALAPYLCGDALVLWPEARLPGARGEDPSPALLRARGAYRARDGELARLDEHALTDMSNCTRAPVDAP